MLAPALRRWNPTRQQWIGGAVAAGVLLGVTYALLRRDEPVAHPGTTPGGEGGGFPLPPEPSPDDTLEPEDPDLPDPGVPPQDPGNLDPGPGDSPDVDDDYEPPQGGIDLPPGGGQPPDLGPVIGPIGQGIFVPPPTELIYTPATEHLALKPTSWLQRYTQHIVLFDFGQGQHRLLTDWTLRFGLCLSTNATFGELTRYMQGVGQPEVDFQQGLADPMLRFGIRNVDALPIQLANFEQPLTYKKRFALRFRKGNPVRITQSVHEINDWATLDPCAERIQRWPTPAKSIGFWVKRVGGAQYELWKPAPDVSVVVQGPKIVLRLAYVGFPYFQVTQGESNAGNPPTEFKLDLKVHAKGTNS